MILEHVPLNQLTWQAIYFNKDLSPDLTASIYGIKESRYDKEYLLLLTDNGLTNKDHRVTINWHDGKIIRDIDILADLIINQLHYFRRKNLHIVINSGYVVDYKDPSVVVYRTDKSRIARDARGRTPPEIIDSYSFKHPQTLDNIVERLEQLDRNVLRASEIRLVGYEMEDVREIAREIRTFRYLPKEYIFIYKD